MKIVIAAMLALALGGCYEGASTYSPSKGRYVDTESFKKEYGITDVCQRASCWDTKSGHFVSADDYNKRQRERAENAR